MELTEEHIEKIHAKIREQQLTRADLEADIMDHICCTLESSHPSEEYFDEVLNEAIQTFAPSGGIRALELEINYMSNIKSVIMKKALLICASIALAFFFASLLVQTIFHGGSWLIKLAFLNEFSVCLFLLPIYWIYQYRVSLMQPAYLSGGWNRIFFISGFLCSEMISTAVFLKIMHMPGANAFFMIGGVFGIIYAPLIGWRKATEMRLMDQIS